MSNYDVVLDTLQLKYDKLWQITETNMRSEYIGMGIMDDIRLEQMAQLQQAMQLWKTKNEQAN